MVGSLLKKTRREIFSQRGKVISSMFLVFVAVWSYVTFSAMMPMMRATIDNMYETYAAPDFMAVTYSVPRSHIDDIGDIEGVEAFTSRYHLFGEVNLSESESSSADLYGVDASAPPDVFKLLIDQGSYLDPSNNHTALIEKSFAVAHGIALGSSLTMSVVGESFELEVVGIVVSLEHLFPHRNPKQLIFAPSRASFSAVAPVWLDISVIQELAYSGSGEKDVVNEILVRFQEGSDSALLSDAIIESIAPYPIMTTLDVQDLRSSELQRFDVADEFILVFAGMIFAVAAFVVFVTAKRIVEYNSREIGITLSLGYRAIEIQKSYLLVMGGLAASVSLAALPLGEPGGIAILQSFASAYSMEIQTGALSPWVYVLAFIAGPLTVLVAVVFPVRKISRYEPIRAIRGWTMELDYVGETILERLGSRVGFKSYGFKFVARGISRNKVRAILMILGIAMGAAVAHMGTMMVGGFNSSIDTYMDHYEHWDLIVDFTEPINSSEVQALMAQLGDVEYYEPYLKLGATIHQANRPKLVSLLALNTTGRLHGFNIESGREISSQREILVDTTVANSLGVDAGDVLNLTIGSSADLFTVVGIVSSPMSVLYLSLTETTEILGTEMLSGLFAAIASGADAEAVADAAFSLDYVENAATKNEASSGVISATQGVAVAIGMAAIAMLLLVAVVWNIVSISVGERIPEFAQLEALGWSRNRLSRLLFLEIYIVTLAGVLVSIPIGQAFSFLFQGFMESFIPFYTPLFDIPSLLGVLLLTFLTTSMAVMPSVRRLRRIDVEKTIRERQMT